MTFLVRGLALTSILFVLAGCMAEAPEMSEAESEAMSQARADAIAAECALYAGTGITPEGC